MEQQFPNNSDTYRKASVNPTIKPLTENVEIKKEEPLPTPIVSGEVKARKKTMADKAKSLFIKEDAKSVWSYVFGDILIPALKNTFVDMVRNGVEMMVLGTIRPKRYDDRRSDYGSPRIRYQDYYDRDYDSSRGRVQTYAAPTYSYNDMVFETRGDAELVITRLRERIRESGSVSISYLYSLVNWDSDYTASGYGWTYLGADVSDIILTRNGYWLRLPKPVAL